MGRRDDMRAAGALCCCGSHDVRHSDAVPNTRRPRFRCGSCEAEWTCGDDGEPYMTFAQGYRPSREMESRLKQPYRYADHHESAS